MYLLLRFTPENDFEEFFKTIKQKTIKHFIVRHIKGKNERLHYHILVEVSD